MKNVPLKPVYLLLGEDQSLIQPEFISLRDFLLQGEDKNLSCEEFEISADLPVSLALDACLTPPFFSTLRIIIMKLSAKLSKVEVDQISDYIASPSEFSRLVIIGQPKLIDSKFRKLIEGSGHIVDCNSPEVKGRAEWIQSKINGRSITLKAQATKYIEEHLGNDISRLDGLLQLLESTYEKGSHLDISDVEPFLGSKGAIAPWGLNDAIDQGDAAKALSEVHRLLVDSNRHPLQVLSAIETHYDLALRINGLKATSETQVIALLGLKTHSYVVKKALARQKLLGVYGLKRAYIAIYRADLDLKGITGLNQNLIIEILVAKLAQITRQFRQLSSR